MSERESLIRFSRRTDRKQILSAHLFHAREYLIGRMLTH